MTDAHRRFPPELRTASVVPRWSIVWTLTRDTVANHSFYVAFYAREIARLIQWQGSEADLMYRALVHDLDETITGDIVSPVKDKIVDNTKSVDYIQGQMALRLPGVVDDERDITNRLGAAKWNELYRIIKVADKLDALIFLIVESRLGNGVIQPHLPYAWDKLEHYWYKLPVPMHAPAGFLQKLWLDVIMPAVEAHKTNGGFGI